MMKVKYALLFAIIILIAGCQSGSGGKNTQQNVVNFRTGTDALVMNFAQGNPDKVYEGENDINFLVEVQNKGAFPQFDERSERLDAHIWVSGFDTRLMELFPEQDVLDERILEGKSPINLEGGRTSVILNGGVFNLPEGTSSFKVPIIVTLTHRYMTIASPTVCIDPIPRAGKLREKVCDIGKFGSVAYSGGQGSPVIVSKVEQEVTSRDLIFRIEVQHVGKGILLDDALIRYDPNRGYSFRDLNRVKIDEISLAGGEGLNCRPDGEIQLVNNKGYIICSLSKSQVEGNNVYQTPLTIKLRYGYSSSIRKDIEILKELSLE